MNRRGFVLTAAAASQVRGANEKVRVGLIGCGGRGRYVGGFMGEAPGVEFTALCDLWPENRTAAQKLAGGKAREYGDFRKLLADKDVDAVLIATPDHWHAICALEAIAAGKHVYIEKPLAHNILEGQAVVRAAAAKPGQVVMAGTQQRSAEHYREIQDFLQSGRLGEVRYVRVWNFTNLTRKPMGPFPDEAAPEGLDWDFYCGPAPLRPFNKMRFLSTFRWFWDYAGGTITDYGTHRFDTVHQIMGQDQPRTVAASGHRYSLKDGGEMPDLLQVTYEYPGFTMSYEACNMSAHGLGGRTAGMRYYNAQGELDRPHGEAYYGTKGALFCDRIGWELFPDGEEPKRMWRNTRDATSVHAQHFIACIRGSERPRSSALTGHRATTIAHLGNIAMKTGRKLQWDGAAEVFPGDAAANGLLGRQWREPWGGYFRVRQY